MGTRAIIRVEGVNYCEVYKHYDGYPEGTLPWLKSFNADFTAHRGDDVEYKMAQLLRSSIRDADKYPLDKSDYTGWGVIPYGSDYGEEYRYTLRKDGSVDVEEVTYTQLENGDWKKEYHLKVME